MGISLARVLGALLASGIFLHASSGPRSPTVGCTAMSTEIIRDIVHSLRRKMPARSARDNR